MPLPEIQDVFKTALEELPVAVYLVDREHKVVFWNRAAERISGFLKQDVLGRSCRGDLLVDSKGQRAGSSGEASQLLHTMQDGKRREADVFLHHKSGHRVPVHVHTVALRNEQHTISGALETLEEIRLPSRQGAAQPWCSSHSNFISSLPDRQAILAHAEEARGELLKERIPFCVLQVQPDGLEQFRSKYGKGAVDAMMQVTAQTLTSALHSSDIAGSWDAGQFVVILRNCPAAALKKAGERIRRMADYSDIEWWGDRIPIAVSVGGAAAVDTDTTETLLDRVGQALEQSARRGGDCVTVLPDDQNQTS